MLGDGGQQRSVERLGIEQRFQLHAADQDGVDRAGLAGGFRHHLADIGDAVAGDPIDLDPIFRLEGLGGIRPELLAPPGVEGELALGLGRFDDLVPGGLQIVLLGRGGGDAAEQCADREGADQHCASCGHVDTSRFVAKADHRPPVRYVDQNLPKADDRYSVFKNRSAMKRSATLGTIRMMETTAALVRTKW